MRLDQTRTYDRTNSVVFLKTNAPFGGLSNMAGGFPLKVNGIHILTSEALYQACRFPHLPEVQALIIGQSSPMTAKMKTKPYRGDSRPDWDQVRVRIMRWCLRVKLAQNWDTFSELLLETGDRPIVEESRKDQFWGAYPFNDGTLVGINVLGRLLMELRENIKNENHESIINIKPITISNFFLGGQPIETINSQNIKSIKSPSKSNNIKKISTNLLFPITSLKHDLKDHQEHENKIMKNIISDNISINEVPSFGYTATKSKSSYTADLKPYAEYKESGLPWLGRVPKHWETRPAFGVFVPNRERNRGMKEKVVLSLSYGRIIIKPTDKLHGLVPESFETYQIVNPGDIIIRTTDLQNDHTSIRVGMVKNRGIITSAYLSLKTLSGVEPNFGFQFLSVWDSTKAIYGYGSGLRQNLDFSHFKRMPVPLPPPDEQAAIVRFLDWANGRLERAIRAKRKVIALLNEQKQAIIHCAVTRGLDPSVPLKPSGVPWLGEIPAHWEVSAIGAAAVLIQTGPFGSQLHSHEYIAEGIPVINPSHMVGGRIQPSMTVTINNEKAKELCRHFFISGDIVIARRGDLGRCALVTPAEEGWVCGTGSLLFRCKRSIVNPEFFQILFASRGNADMLNLSSIGATMANLNAGTVARQRLPLPPLDEQQRIVRFIEHEIHKIKLSISHLEREVELLREYRTRLVADVVTGKLDVREAAARLSDEGVLQGAADAGDDDLDDASDDLPDEEADE
jgi:type I restriction enzyme S subunit